MGGFYFLGRRLLPPWSAALAASFFAVSPLHAGTVGWIAGRADVLAAFFCALSAWAFLVALDIGRSDRSSDGGDARARAGAVSDRRGRVIALAASAVLLLAGLLSKESAIALAVFLPMAAWFAGRRGRRLAEGILAAAVPVAAYAAMRYALNPHPSGAPPVPGSPGAAGGGASSALWTAAWLVRRLAVPFFDPPFQTAPPQGALPLLAGGLLIAVGSAMGIAAWRARRGDRLLALAWILCAAAVPAAAASRAITRTPVADRYLYMASGGLGLALAAWLLSSPAESQRHSQDGRRGGALETSRRRGVHAGGEHLRASAGWILVALSAVVAIARLPVYAGDLAFWTRAAAGSPSQPGPAINLGNALASRGDHEGAKRAYEHALSLGAAGTDRALAMSDLGAVLYQEGRMDEAEKLLREAAAMPGADATVNFNLGAFLFQKALADVRKGDGAAAGPVYEEAARWLAAAVEQDPYHVGAWLLLGHCHAAAGRIGPARAAWARVVAIDGRDGIVGREAVQSLAQTERLPQSGRP